MPKGEAPGPFYTKAFAGRTTVYERPHPIACFQPGETVGPCEMARYADLLNKGTHYDAMLKALKGITAIYDEKYQPGGSAYADEMDSVAYDAIAATKGPLAASEEAEHLRDLAANERDAGNEEAARNLEDRADEKARAEGGSLKTESVTHELRVALRYSERTTRNRPRRFELDPDWYTQFIEECRVYLTEDIGEGEYEPDMPVMGGNRRPCIMFCDIPVVPHSGPLETGFLVVM